ncbi:MAG: LytTR family DNA-binding domain-containing protein [Bacteroidetes bacterium]|nr:LytTR family DNA-binding domain-containing protein [Bacteroidota bacterium]
MPNLQNSNKKIQTVLIEDEFSAMRTLRGMLEQYCPQVRIIGQAASVAEANALLHRTRPELVFLDIEMPPGGTAFDLLKQTQDLNFGIIFTTAYPKYAIEAINKAQPWGYLVKPFSVENLKDVVNAACEKLEDDAHGGFVVHDSRKGMLVVRFEDILFCEADGALVDIVLLKNNKVERISTYKALKELELDLPQRLFCRSHHSFIVHMRYIDRVEKTGRNGLIHLSNGMQVGISVQRMHEFEEKFEAFLKG